MEKSFGKAAEAPKAYLTAEAYANQAVDALNEGNVNSGDSLFDASLRSYPTTQAFNYVKAVGALPEINKAIALTDKILDAVKNFPGKEIVIIEPFPATFVNGQMTQGLKQYPNDRALFNFAFEAYKIIKAYGSSKHLLSLSDRIATITITSNPVANLGLDYEVSTQQSLKVAQAILKKEYDRAIQLIESMPSSPAFPPPAKLSQLAAVYIEKGDYAKAVAIAEQNESGDFAGGAYKLKFIAYTLAGNFDEALKYYKTFTASKYYSPLNDEFYYLALLDIGKKDFNAALTNLDRAVTYKTTGYSAGLESLFTDKWKVYKAYGDAYAGLRQYERARDNYQISLLANADYQPAVDALVTLESLIAAASSTDKTPPTINITEPAIKRGLKVTGSGAEIMVRGTAQDPSGLKSVSINGRDVYAQAAGNFWGSVPLKEGSNQLAIKATDGAGNTGEYQLVIEKAEPAKTTTQNSDVIVPVTETEGKNYCLLIAAQNYKDGTIPSLDNPIQDAVRLKLLLKSHYNFNDENILTLFNPEANDIKRQLLELTNKIQPEDNLLIFYAGHGIWVEKEKKGYWLMTDAARNNPNTWVSNTDVLNLIAKLPSRHTLLITDACFSGGVFKTRSIGTDASESLKLLDEKISRVAITSGNDTEVPDESVFMKYLVKALTENKEKYLTAQKMFITKILEAVMTESKTEPRYGTLEAAGHVGGDYIFVRK